jgi:hypothetical protein
MKIDWGESRQHGKGLGRVFARDDRVTVAGNRVLWMRLKELASGTAAA